MKQGTGSDEPVPCRHAALLDRSVPKRGRKSERILLPRIDGREPVKGRTERDDLTMARCGTAFAVAQHVPAVAGSDVFSQAALTRRYKRPCSR
ncbi:hypothetical protein G3N57_06490 [Paraburkholderia sp. Se-20369]|nr:hypothetical protein [Paraburkholderia sp. Se-20369]